jgi:O-antigen/teichoic acid export membrane protein
MAKKITTDIFSLFSSSFVGQLIHVIALPYLTGFFSKESIGAFFLFQSIVTFGLILCTLQSEQAIVIESNENSYLNYRKSIIILTALSFIAFIFLTFSIPLLQKFSGKTSITDWGSFIAPALFINGFINSSEYLFTHEKRFKTISVFRIARPLFIYLFAFFFKYQFPLLNNSLIFGFLLGNLIILLIYLLLIISNKQCHFKKEDFTIQSFKTYYFKHKNIFLFNTFSTFLVSISTFIPYLFISFVFGEKMNAYYGMSMRIIGMPFGLLGQSFGQVYLQKFSSIFARKHSFYPIAKRMVIKLYTIGVVPFILLLFYTPLLYNLFLGKGWDVAVSLSRILLPWLFLGMVSSPVSNISAIVGVQNKTIGYDILMLTFRLIGLCFCWYIKLELIPTMMIFSFIGVFFSLLYQYVFLRIAKNYSPL